MLAEIHRNVRHNFVVSVLDGVFFGFGLGFASSVTVIPLFVNSLTDSTLLIGLIASIQTIGWQLPQLLMAGRVARLRRYKPLTVLMSFHERWPFFGLALVAWSLPALGPQMTLVLTYALLIWQALGGGFTATAWQSMTGKIMPPNRRGTFWGIQGAGVNLMTSLGAVIAGLLLAALSSPLDYSLCFLLAGLFMLVSWAFLAMTREPENPAESVAPSHHKSRHSLAAILRSDTNFRWFLAARIFAQIAWTAISFYTIYAVRHFGMDERTAGWMTGLLALTHMVASPLVGAAGDRWGHRFVFTAGALLMAASALLALAAPELGWFFIVFGLAGIFNAINWTTTLAMTVEFGTESQRPLYIGLANTLVGPASLLAPIAGGWLAETFGFQTTFLMSAISGLLTAAALMKMRPHQAAANATSPARVAAYLEK